MEARLDREALAAGETATLSVTVEGRGNVNRVPDLAMPAIPGIRVYPAQPTLKTEQDSQGSKGVKTMKWPWCPKGGGPTDPSPDLSYFDTCNGLPVIRTDPQYSRAARRAREIARHRPGRNPALSDTAKKEVVEVGWDSSGATPASRTCTAAVGFCRIHMCAGCCSRSLRWHISAPSSSGG